MVYSQTKQGGRVALYDIMKGLGILAIVMGHCRLAEDFVYLFHIPLFMFISGIFHHTEDITGVKDFGKRLKKQIVRCYIPFVTIEIIFVLLHNVFEKIHWISGPSYTLHNQIFYCLKILTMGYGESLVGTLWFIISLFEIAVFFDFFLFFRKILPKYSQDGCLIILAIGLFYLGLWVKMPRSLDASAALFIYYCLGYFVRKFQLFQRVNYIWGIVAFIIVFAGSFTGRTYRTASWPVVTFLYSFSGIIFVYSLSRLLERFPYKEVFLFMGKRSFSIMAFHFVGFKVWTSLLIGVGIYAQAMLTYFPTPPVGVLSAILYCFAGVTFSCLLYQIYAFLKKKAFLFYPVIFGKTSRILCFCISKKK